MVLNALKKRTSMLILATVVGTFYFERIIFVPADAFFDNWNKGVSNISGATQTPVVIT